MRNIQSNHLLFLLSVLLLMSMVAGVVMGAVSIPFTLFLDSVLSFLPISNISISNISISNISVSESSNTYFSILYSIRLPRVCLAAIIGALLALSGAVMQGLFRNPLADPSLIGVTAGASLGGSIAIFLLTASSGLVVWGVELHAITHTVTHPVNMGLPLVSFGAFLGGLLAVYIVHSLAHQAYGTSVATMLLAGIAITALAASATSFLEFISDNDVLRRISLWRMGGLEGADTTRVAIAGVMLCIVCIMLPRYSQALNALLLGESEARHLGIDVEKLKRQLIILVAACIGICVALAGTIAFVGLVIPHVIRLLIGPNHRYLLPASALAGAVLLVLSDLLARLLIAPTVLPVGIVTALIGVPFFVSLLKRRYVYGVS